MRRVRKEISFLTLLMKERVAAATTKEEKDRRVLEINERKRREGGREKNPEKNSNHQEQKQGSVQGTGK